MTMGARTSRLRELQEGLERQGRGDAYQAIRFAWIEIGTHGAYIDNHTELRDLVESIAIELATPNPDRAVVSGMLERISSAVPQSEKKGAARVKQAIDALRAATAQSTNVGVAATPRMHGAAPETAPLG